MLPVLFLTQSDLDNDAHWSDCRTDLMNHDFCSHGRNLTSATALQHLETHSALFPSFEDLRKA